MGMRVEPSENELSGCRGRRVSLPGMEPNPYKSPEGADLAPPRIQNRLDDRHSTVIYLWGILVCAVAVALMAFGTLSAG